LYTPVFNFVVVACVMERDRDNEEGRDCEGWGGRCRDERIDIEKYWNGQKNER
jgi:hypothetical protein